MISFCVLLRNADTEKASLKIEEVVASNGSHNNS